MGIVFNEKYDFESKANNIYKLISGNYYFTFYRNNNEIFRLSCAPKETLKKIMVSFDFI